MKSQNLWIVLACIPLLVLTTACGTKNTPVGGSTDSSSTDPAAVNKVLADCAKGSGQSISARVQLSKDNYNNYSTNKIRVKFDSTPSVYDTDGNYELEIRLWTAAYNAATNTVTKHFDSSNSSVMTFDYQTGSTFQPLAIGSAYPLSLIKDEIADIVKYNSMTMQSPSEFFKNVVLNIDLKDEQGSYKALEINFLDGNGAVKYSTNVLIPRFEVNPDEYIADHPQLQVLWDIHPLKSLAGSGFTTTQFQTESAKACL